MHGEPVIMRSGEAYTFGGYNPSAQPFQQVLGWDSNGGVMTHHNDGKYIADRESPNDLFMKPIEKELFIAVATNKKDGVFNTSYGFENEELAINWIGGRRNTYTIIKVTIQI